MSFGLAVQPVSCPMCNESVHISKINAHIDSNCTSYVHTKKKCKKKVCKSQSTLTQYFRHHKEEKPITISKSYTNTRKRSRKELEMNHVDIVTPPSKRMKIEDHKEESVPFQYETLECTNDSCSQWMHDLRCLDTTIDMNDTHCIQFDQRIVGKKFCSNKSYHSTTHPLYRNKQAMDTQMQYLDIIHEFDNTVDGNAVVIVECQNQVVHALGYFPKTISQYIVDLMNDENIDILVYKIPDNDLTMARIHIVPRSCLSEPMAKKINNLKQLLRDNQHQNDLYFEILSNILVSNAHKYSHLFDDDEMHLLHSLIELKDEEEANHGIRLLSRLILRKRKWFKTNALSYDQITDINDAISVLIKHNVLTESHCGPISLALLECVGKEILMGLSHKSGLKIKRSNGKHCTELRQSIIHQISTQKTIFGVTLANNPTFIQKCHSIIGNFVSITPFAMDLLSKCQLLFYLDTNTTIQDTVLSHIGFKTYPKYKVYSNDEGDVIFPTKQIFMKYSNALQFKSEFDELHAIYTMDKSNETELVDKIKECADKVTEIVTKDYSCASENRSHVDSFVSNYRELHIYSRVLHRGVKEVIEKLPNKQYEWCCSLYQQLLGAQPFSYKRGQWFCRLALLLHHHLKQYTLSYSVCYDGLNDDYVEIAHRNELIKRYQKLHKHLGLNKKLDIPTSNSSCFACNVSLDPKGFQYIVIDGKPFNCAAGTKSKYFGYDDTVVGVEELVLQYFEQEQNGSWNGIHCEASVYRMIFAVFMWNIIFCEDTDIAYVFQSKYQNAPLDMNTEWFYLNRKDLIDSHANVLGTLNAQDIEAAIHTIYDEHYGECAIGVYWDRFELNQLTDICQSIGGFGIAQICLLLAKNYRFWSGGLPDLLLWRNGTGNGNTFECKIVEVKGARDHLSEKQICWISYLTQCAKLDVFVAKIKEQY